ncbi:MAG: hypothetical protein ACI35N_02825 [Marinilabiliaceae bacterium]
MSEIKALGSDSKRDVKIRDIVKGKIDKIGTEVFRRPIKVCKYSDKNASQSIV